MANRYWVGGTDTWNATAGSKWSATSGGAGGASVPTAADDVFLDGNSGSGTVTIGGTYTALCRSLDCTGFTGTLTGTNSGSNMQVGDASGGAFTLSAGMTFTPVAGSTITFASTSDNGGTGWAITTNGKQPRNVTFNGAGGKWVFQDAFTSNGGTVTLTAGTLDTNNQAVSSGALVSNNNNTRTLTLGSTTWTTTTSNTPINISGSNLTLNAGTSTVIFNSISNSANWGSGTTWYNIVADGAGVVGTAALNCVNFTRTGTSAKTDGLRISGSITCSGTFTANGNSATNRLLISSSAAGSSATITAATVSCSNADFMDITGAGAGSWNLASITGGSGDALGNSGITFTTPVSRYAVASGNWSSTSMWSASSGGSSGASVPLPQDAVYLDASSAAGTYTADMPRMGKNIDCTGFTRTLFLTSVPLSNYGNFTLSSGLTLVQNQILNLSGRSSQTFTSAGKTFGSVVVLAPGGVYTQLDAFTTIQAFTVTNGGWATGNYSHTSKDWSSSNSNVRSIDWGTSTITVTTTENVGTPVNFATSTNLTLVATSSTVVIAGATAFGRTFAGGGLTYGTLTYTVANSPGALTITGANIFNTINASSTRAISLAGNQAVRIFNVNGANNGYLWLPGLSTNFASAPDAAPLDITGDISLQLEAALVDWTPSAVQVMLGKWRTGAVSSGTSYAFVLETNGRISLYLSNGSSNAGVTSSVAAPFTDGVKYHVGVTYRTSDRRVQFWTSTDGITWTQLGTDQTHSIASITDSASTLKIGAFSNSNTDAGDVPNANMCTGAFYRAKVFSGVRDFNANSGGTLAFDADFTTKSVGANTFTESSSNAATVTINGATAQVGDGRVAVNSNLAGTTREISKYAGGYSLVNYVVFQDITVAQPYALYAANSVDVSNNRNITFSGTIDPITHKQGSDGVTDTPVTTISKTLDEPTVAGNLLIAYYYSAGATGTITPPSGFVLAKTDNIGSNYPHLYYKIADGTETTITFSQTDSRRLVLAVTEYEGWSGVPTKDVDESNSNAGAVTSLSTTASTGPTNTGQPAIALAWWTNSNTLGNFVNITNGWYGSEKALFSSAQKLGVKVITAPETVETTLTWQTSRAGIVAVMAVFKDVSAGGGTGNFLMFM